MFTAIVWYSVRAHASEEDLRIAKIDATACLSALLPPHARVHRLVQIEGPARTSPWTGQSWREFELRGVYVAPAAG